MPDWAGGAYIAEEVAPWIDSSGNLVAASGGAAVGTPAPGTLDQLAAPPESRPHAKAHPLQPLAAHNHRRPAVRTGKYVAAQPFDAPTGASGNLQLLGLSHAKPVHLTPQQILQRALSERQPYPWTSPSHPLGPHYTNAQLRPFGATPDEVWIIDRESGGYTHAWNHDRTTTGYAYGLGQVAGDFRLANFGRRRWESANPRVQIKMMQDYIRHGSQHFHTDAGAKKWWEANNWY